MTEGSHAEQKTKVGSLHTMRKSPLLSTKPPSTSYYLPCTASPDSQDLMCTHTQVATGTHSQAYSHTHTPSSAHVCTCIHKAHTWHTHTNIESTGSNYTYTSCTCTLTQSFEYVYTLGQSKLHHSHNHIYMCALIHTFPDMRSHRHTHMHTHMSTHSLGTRLAHALHTTKLQNKVSVSDQRKHLSLDKAGQYPGQRVSGELGRLLGN